MLVPAVVGPELVGEQRNEPQGALAHEATLEVPVRRINGRRIEPGLCLEVAGWPDRVPLMTLSCP